jgi:hypothetical protein
MFQGTKLRTNYKEITSASLVTAAATNQASALMVLNFDKGARYFFMDNRTDAEITLYMVSPDVDFMTATIADRQLWLRISPAQVLNFDFLPNVQMFFPAQAIMYASYESGAPSTGKIKISWYG